MRSRRERIIQVSARISSLREMVADYRSELAIAEAELDALMNGEDVPAPMMPLVDRVVRVLDGNPDKTWTIDEIVEALGDPESIASLRSTLARLASPNIARVLRSGRGEYRSTKLHKITGIDEVASEAAVSIPVLGSVG